MVAYNFQRRFVPAIESGAKCHTIRRISKRRHARVGEFLQLYTGMRTKSCRKIFEDDRICTLSSRIDLLILPNCIGAIRLGEARSYGKRLRHTDCEEQIERFAVEDGFDSAADMHAFWLDFHGAGTFRGMMIGWDAP